MKKKNILTIVVLVIIIVGLMFWAIRLISNNSNDSDSITNKDDEIYLNIIKNEEKNGDLTLNTSENTKYYYFDIVNYNEEEQKYNETKLTPYVKIVFNNNDETNFVSWNLYSMNNETDLEEAWTEITEKGESDSNFAEYYKCNSLGIYNSESEDENVGHYVLKIVLDTENEQLTNLEESLTESFSIVLGYREIK